MNTRILLIDDDRKLCRLIGEYLGPLGYEVVSVHSGPEGAERAVADKWEAIILDVMLPGCDGFEVLKRIRQSSEVPVLMLTARGDETDRIVGLEIGADDYLPKTFSTRELLARLRAVTRRAANREPAPMESSMERDIVLGPLRIHPASHIATLNSQPLVLTPVEYGLLLSLAKAAGRVKTRERLLEEIRERDFDVYDRSIDVHISALRKKLGDDPKNPQFIRTIRAVGYLMADPSHSFPGS